MKQWKNNFDSKNLDGIVKTYTTKAILVSTFGGIIEGRAEIKKYFTGLFKKKKLNESETKLLQSYVILSLFVFLGIYLIEHIICIICLPIFIFYVPLCSLDFIVRPMC
jgi:hypothetical protein